VRCRGARAAIDVDSQLGLHDVPAEHLQGDSPPPATQRPQTHDVPSRRELHDRQSELRWRRLPGAIQPRGRRGDARGRYRRLRIHVLYADLDPLGAAASRDCDEENWLCSSERIVTPCVCGAERRGEGHDHRESEHTHTFTLLGRHGVSHSRAGGIGPSPAWALSRRGQPGGLAAGGGLARPSRLCPPARWVVLCAF
jgi:hypothetical protein